MVGGSHAFLEPLRKLSRDQLHALQLERLRATLEHVYAASPVHRARFDAHGVTPDDLQDLGDLARFPLTTKQDLREHYPFGLFCVPREQVARVHASSGTTGKPTVVGYTREDIDHWATCVARSIEAAGGRPGDRVQVAYGYGLFTGGLGAHYGAEKLHSRSRWQLASTVGACATVVTVAMAHLGVRDLRHWRK